MSPSSSLLGLALCASLVSACAMVEDIDVADLKDAGPGPSSDSPAVGDGGADGSAGERSVDSSSPDGDKRESGGPDVNSGNPVDGNVDAGRAADADTTVRDSGVDGRAVPDAGGARGNADAEPEPIWRRFR
jgi:hypothetical protein